MTTDEPRVWTVDVPPPTEFITANDRRARSAYASAVAEWRAAAFVAAHRAKLPKGLARVRMDITIAPATRGLDADALRPTCKAVVDGFGPAFVRQPDLARGYRGAAAPGYGLIPNDDPQHLDGYHLHLLPPRPRGRVSVTVVDLTDVPAGRTWTPALRTATGRRITTKRACNRCDRFLGDVRDEEVAAAIAGAALPDVTGECPDCATSAVA